LLTESEVERLLASKTENRNLDYKRSVSWGEITTAEKGAIVKDVLAMSNTQNGGTIIFGVRDGDFEPVGMDESHFLSFDPTRFSDFVNRYADPPIACKVQKFVIRRMRFLVIGVPEFTDVPTLCRADLNDARGYLILKKGATYVCTERAASEIVSTAETMRDLIDRSVATRGDRFLNMVDRVMGHQADKRRLADLEVKHKEAVAELEHSYDFMFDLLGGVLDLKSTNAGHSRRVTAYTIVIARTLGLPREQIEGIARGAFLHDIGKMAVPEAILTKAGSLTPGDMSIVKRHPLVGYRILQRAPFLAGASEIVYSHHERHDGTGYPRRLTGDEIPLGARIVAVANALDSIMSELPYRAARPLGEARAEIERQSGRQFDPKIVEAFLRVPDELWDDLRREIDQGLES
jgi:putative nucleotidyltransferase with HDIG domain